VNVNVLAGRRPAATFDSRWTTRITKGVKFHENAQGANVAAEALIGAASSLTSYSSLAIAV
jgi:hypothetical protein